MSTQMINPADTPSWASPEAWTSADQIVDRALKNYAVHANKLEANHYGRYVVIDSEEADRYAIGDTELEAEDKFHEQFGTECSPVLFQIGYTTL